jgi:hypothetical protein
MTRKTDLVAIAIVAVYAVVLGVAMIWRRRQDMIAWTRDYHASIEAYRNELRERLLASEGIAE